MKKVDLDHQCNSIELLITLKQIIFNLTEENFLLSIDQTMKLYDSNFPYSLNFIISSLLYYSFCSMKNGINIILNYLEAIQTKEEEMNKNYPKIIDVFIQRISKIKSQETYYMLGKMIERSSNDTINFYSKYFAHIKYFNYCYNKDVEYNQIEKDIIEKYEKLSKNDWEHHKQLIKEGVNPNEIAKIIRNDEIDKLQEISSQTKFNFNQYIQPSIYERYTFINEESVSLIMYAAFFSSVKCFKYLLMNKANVYNIDKYAVAGGNEEIIHLCEQDHVMNGVYETAIKFHQNDIFKYFYEKQNVHLNLQALGRICIFSHNYEILLFLIENGMKIDSKKIKEAAGNGDLYIVKYFLQNNQIPNDILLYSSESGNFELVKYTLEQKGVDVNSKKINLSCFMCQNDIWKLFKVFETALMKATLNNDIELVKLLLEQEKIIVNDRDISLYFSIFAFINIMFYNNI